jgi:putative membrane-bound dehydrogenase-like protein
MFVVSIVLLALAAPGASAAEKKKLVLITQSVGFDHDVVKPRPGDKPSIVHQTFLDLAAKTGLFDVEHSRDASILTPEKLKQTEIVVFYTTGTADKQLPMKAEDLDAFVNNGGKFLGIHPATDTFHNTPVYQKLIGGEFVDHPWHAKDTVTIKVLDPEHAAAKPWIDAGAGLTFKEEIYQHKNFDPANVHVILGLDMEKTELKRPMFIPIAWCKEQGKGRLFYTSLGHRDDVWGNPRYQDHLVAAIKWLTGEAAGDATPNPDMSKREDDLAKKVAPPDKPKEPEKKAAAEEPKLPAAPNGFTLSVFARAPDIKSPASIAAAPDGKIFVGEDEYNTQPKRDPGLSRVKLCVDTDHDGKADKFTVFADKLNSPQGMTFVGGTLYVVHAPLLTAFRDTNNDGVADERVDLIHGLGPAPEGLVHHVPSGLHMGIDGWLYISIGDKGIAQAIGTDGRKVSVWGGGVVRVRPDGTMMELFSARTRNTFDVSVDPLLGVFTRDNTNDGNGWDSRLAQMQRGGEYGYPSLYKNFPDEIVEPIASYGSGSATGSTYVHEPDFPGKTGDSLYTCDWARGTLYRHEIKRKGAAFEATQEEFLKGITPADVEVDGNSKMYVADWGRRDWGNAGEVGTIFLIQPSKPTTQPTATATAPVPASAPAARFADLTQANDDELLAGLASPSAVMRLEVQQEILRRGTRNGAMSSALRSAAMRRGELYARVAALFTLKQLDGEAANPMLATLAQVPELREFSLRALADRDDQHYGVNEQLFLAGLKDPNPRVREQAAIGLGYLKKPELAPALVPSTADTDPLVRHAAMQSLRRLGAPARDACIAALAPSSPPEVVVGALRTLREFHDEKTVNAIAALQASRGVAAAEIIKALAKLYHVEGPWDGKSWWTPHPDTRGPYYVHVAWSQSPRVANLLLAAANDSEVATAKMALNYIGLVEMKEAAPQLVRMITAGGAMRDDAAKALIAVKAATPEALAALERVVLSDNFNGDVRGAAAQSLASIDAAKAQPILLRVLVQLDRAPDAGDKKLPPGLLEKVADSLASRPTPPEMVTSVLPLLGASKPPTRAAAATALLRSDNAAVREQVARVWLGGDPVRIEALLLAVPRVPNENVAPYSRHVHDLLRDERPALRQAATLALGHLGDASAVKDLVQLASRDRDPLPAVSALAGIDPARTADDQILIVATLLVENSTRVQKTNQDAYVRLVGAAQKFLNDPRVPAPKAIALRSKLMEPGVIYNYFRTDPIPLPPNLEEPLKKAFPPEVAAGGPFVPFSVDGKEFSWKPITVSDPKGLQPIEMPADYVMYFQTTYQSPATSTGWLTCGSDDAIAAWLNGKRVHDKPIDRGMLPDTDRVSVPLVAGKNVLLLKIYNRTGPAGVQARLRSRVVEFDPTDAVRATREIVTRTPTAALNTRGRELFESLGCIKCHALNREDEPRGPFLGDAGGKFDNKHLAESIMRPGAKIAQGFASERIITKEEGRATGAVAATPGASNPGPSSAGATAGDYTGFITKDTAEEIHLRDLTGRVTIIRKENVTKRTPQPGSMMPDGLADGLTLDDFAALLSFLSSLK